jgi:hypothetical protein
LPFQIGCFLIELWPKEWVSIGSTQWYCIEKFGEKTAKFSLFFISVPTFALDNGINLRKLQYFQIKFFATAMTPGDAPRTGKLILVDSGYDFLHYFKK